MSQQFLGCGFRENLWGVDDEDESDLLLASYYGTNPIDYGNYLLARRKARFLAFE